MGVETIAASQEMSIAVYGSKADCDTAANIAGKSANGNAQELNFSCDSVDTNTLAKTDADPSMANTLAAPSNAASAPASSTPAPVHANGGGSNPLMWYMLGSMMQNRSGAPSSGFMPSTAGAPAPSGFINSAGHGKMSFGSTATFPSPTYAQYAGLGKNGGVMQTSMIGSKLAPAASYKAATSSINSKSSVASSVGHSSRGGGGGGGGGG